MRRALVAATLAALLHVHPAAAAEPSATPPVGDAGPVDWGDPAPTVALAHAPSFAHKRYPAATQAARDWAWKKLGTRQWLCLDAIGHYESGWRVRAGDSHGSYGIFQAFPASKMRRYGADYLTNPFVQVRFGIAYAARYGTPCDAWAAWQRQGWW